IAILLGNGDGTFQSAVFYTAGSGPNHIAVADYNRDGKLDLAVANAFGTSVSLLLGNGDGSFQSPVDLRVADAPWHIAIADFDGDGNLDLATADYGDGFGVLTSILLGRNDGSFSNPINFTTGTDAHGIVVGDFDFNGTPDLAVTNALENTVTALLNNSPSSAP